MTVSFAQLEEFLRQTPPRHVPKNIRKRRDGSSCGLTIVGSIFLAMGSLFCTIFFPWRFPNEIALDLGYGVPSVAKVTEQSETGISIGDRKVYRVEYHFDTAEQQQIEGTSYFTRNIPNVGERVPVHYLESFPGTSRLEGGRLNVAGYGPAFVIIFPLVGIGILGGTLWYRLHQMKILRWGEFALGTVESIEKTSLVVNNEPRYKIVIKFDSPMLPDSVDYSAFGNDVVLAQEHLNNGSPVGVLFNANKPSHMILAESLMTSAIQADEEELPEPS